MSANYQELYRKAVARKWGAPPVVERYLDSTGAHQGYIVTVPNANVTSQFEGFTLEEALNKALG